MKKSPSAAVKWLGLLVFAGIGSQLVPVARSNPPIASTPHASLEVSSILQRACNDCHSNATAWPWYSQVAPVSWLVARDVRDGREELNFSMWDSYAPTDKAIKLKKSWEEVAEGDMPPWTYVLLHPRARLSDEDKVALKTWMTGAPSGGSFDMANP